MVGGANDRHGIETFPTGIRGGDGKRVVENTALGGDDGLSCVAKRGYMPSVALGLG